MKRIIKILSLSAFFCMPFSGMSQDFHLSQYDAAAVNFNPAMTGMFKGDWRVHAHYRNQWTAVAVDPYTTMVLAFDKPFGKFSGGLQVANFRAGVGNYNVFSALGSIAYDFRLDKNNFHHLSLGVQGGIFQKSVDFSRLTFETQYVNTAGGSFDQSINSQESYSGSSNITPDINAGLMYYYGKEKARVQPFLGGAAFHLTEPNESFFGASNKLPMRWIGHAGAKINLTSKFQLLAKSFYMGQENAREITYSAHIHYYMDKHDAYLIFGPTFRNEDAAIIEAGIKIKGFIYRMSYDINTSSLQPVSNGRGGVEFSLTYIRSKYDPNPVQTCPRL